MPDAVAVSVPASSANLGPGFDCLAAALELRLSVEVRRCAAADAAVGFRGEGAREVPQTRENLLVRAFAAAGGEPERHRFAIENGIPIGRGFGSSAAAVVAGMAAAALLEGRDPAGVLAPAAAMDGHPDNVAAALLGGITVSWHAEDGPRALRLGDAAASTCSFVALVPGRRLETAHSRAALPERVRHADAVHTVACAALLVTALAEGRPELVPEALRDRLHEPHRAALAPLLATVRERLAAAGALGATLSGSGPGVLVWCRPGDEGAVAAALGSLPDTAALPVAVAERGLVVRAPAGA